VFRPFVKGVGFAVSPQGRKVLRNAVAVARSEEAKKLVAQARKVAASPEGRRLAGEATRAAAQASRALHSPEARERLLTVVRHLSERRR